jgi:hypothetical protein
MIYNEVLKREIPEGWADGSLLDVAVFTNGIACQKYHRVGDDTLRVIKIREMRSGFSAKLKDSPRSPTASSDIEHPVPSRTGTRRYPPVIWEQRWVGERAGRGSACT